MTVLTQPRRYVIAFSHAVSELLVVQAVRAYADRRAGEIDGVALLHGNTQSGDLAQQLAEVAGWIDDGVDAIVAMPIDTAALQPLVERAHAKGIRVLSYAFSLPGSDGEVGFDSVLSGQLCGTAAAAFIRAQFPDGGAQALVGALAATPLFAPRWLEPIAAIEAAGGTVDPARSFICGQDGAPEGLREIARGRHYTGTAAILLDQLGAAIVDMSINAIEGRPASVRVPAEYVSRADPERVATLIAAFDTITG